MIELEYACPRCGSVGVTPELPFLDALAVLLHIRHLRCPACGAILTGPLRLSAPASCGKDFVLFPSGFTVFVRTHPPAPSRNRRTVVLFTDGPAPEPLRVLLEASPYQVVTVQASEADLEIVTTGLPEIVILSASKDTTTELLSSMRADPTIKAQFKELRT